MFVSFFIAVFYLTFNMEKMYNFLGNCGSGVRNLACNQRADGSNPISNCLGCCVKPKRSLTVYVYELKVGQFSTKKYTC